MNMWSSAITHFLLFLKPIFMGGNLENSEMNEISIAPLSDLPYPVEGDDLPCPTEGDILPCICTVDYGSIMDMDCTAVKSEDQLAAVFASYLPFATFRRLIINSNQNLKALRPDSFGEANFEEFVVNFGVLEEVQAGALAGSFATATHLSFTWNNIASFPFQEIKSFTNLQSLLLGENNITATPHIESSSLEQFYLYSNPLGSVPLDAFKDIPAVEDISLSDTGLHHVPAGTII